MDIEELIMITNKSSNMNQNDKKDTNNILKEPITDSILGIIKGEYGLEQIKDENLNKKRRLKFFSIFTLN